MKIHVIQYESGGIPEKPQLFTDYEDAFDCFKRFVIEQGFREMLSNEHRTEYYARYWDILQGNEDGDHYEWDLDNSAVNMDDTVRWWTVNLTL